MAASLLDPRKALLKVSNKCCAKCKKNVLFIVLLLYTRLNISLKGVCHSYLLIGKLKKKKNSDSFVCFFGIQISCIELKQNRDSKTENQCVGKINCCILSTDD